MSRPKKLATDKKVRVSDQERRIELACKRYSDHALKVLADCLGNPKVETRWQIAAAKEILDRAWGRPAQSIKADVNISTIDSIVAILKGSQG